MNRPSWNRRGYRRPRAIAGAAALVLFLAMGARAQEAAEETAPDRREVQRLLSKVSLSGGEAVALLALPENLQHKVLKTLAGEYGGETFTTTEWILLEGLPEKLRARIFGKTGIASGRVRPPPEKGEGEDAAKPSPSEPEKGKEEEKKEEEKPAGEETREEPFPLQNVDTDLAPFGADLFGREDQPMPLAPVIPAPADYVLGPGDALLVHYWNALVDLTFTVEVTAEGRVRIPKAGEVTVGGITMEAATRVIEKKIREIFKDASVLVTLHSLRSIRVFVVGEVARPGLHAISALSTVLHALFTAGGPSGRGSYRKIRVIRGEQTVSEVDLYDFLREGRKGGDVRLLSGDTVFVPLAGPRVRVAGKVRRPAVYELREERTLAQVLALAGGVEPGGFSEAIRLERSVGPRVALLDIKGDPAKQAIRDGDTIKVFPVSPEPLERVEVSGSVERPGRYQWTKGMKVSDLLARAEKLLPDAHLGYAEIRRKSRPGTAGGVQAGGRTYYPAWELIRVDLARVLEGVGEADLELARLDRLRILSLSDVKPELTVEIRGAVEKPGVVEYARGMRLLDLLSREGQGLSPGAHLRRAEILRVTGEGRAYAFAHGSSATKARTVTIPVDLAKALAGDPEANLPLKPFDVVKIYHAEEVRPAPEVTVIGAVRHPKTFELTSEMRVSDLVFQAGNITADAYLEKAEVVRRVYNPGTPGTYRMETLTLDLGKALRGDKNHDLLLENFDRVIVRRTSEYVVEVEIKGEVRFPGTYVMPKGSRMTDLIERAGGFNRDAFLQGAFFARVELRRIQEKAKQRFIADQKAKLIEMEAQVQEWASTEQAAARFRDSIRTRKRLLAELEGIEAVGRLAIRLGRGADFRNSPNDLVLRDGDSLAIPETPVSVTVQGEVFAPGSVLYTEGKRIEYYINQVGSLREDADEDRIYLVKADGRAFSRSAQGAFSVRWDAENLRWVRNRLGRVVDPGDIVIVPPKQVVLKGFDLTKDIVDILYKIALSAGVLAGIAG